jgi:hypothetical protein
MQFTLTLNLDNDDAVTAGPDALAGYLRDVASRVQAGYGNGNVRDVNGNTIGHYAIEDGPGKRAARLAAEVPGRFAAMKQAADEYAAGEIDGDGLRSAVVDFTDAYTLAQSDR